MKRADLTEKLLDIKREKGWTWKHICKAIGGHSEVLIVSAILGQMKLTKPQADDAAKLFGLSKVETAKMLTLASASGPASDAMIPVAENCNGPSTAMQRHPFSQRSASGATASAHTIDNSSAVRVTDTKGPSVRPSGITA